MLVHGRVRYLTRLITAGDDAPWGLQGRQLWVQGV